MQVNISAAFAKADRPRNGLAAIADKLVNDDLQHAEYYGVVKIKPNFYKTSAEDGERTATVKMPQIEVVVDEADVEAVRTILARRYKDRTGLEDSEPDALFDVTGDGRVVPEAGAEEILAEARERREADLNAEATRVADEAEAARGDGPDTLPAWDDGTCGDCVDGKCHGGDPDDCECARHAASVDAAQDGGDPA